MEQDFEHGAEALWSVVPPELSGKVARWRGGDEVASGLGAGVLCARTVAKVLDLFMDVDAEEIRPNIHPTHIHTCAKQQVGEMWF